MNDRKTVKNFCLLGDNHVNADLYIVKIIYICIIRKYIYIHLFTTVIYIYSDKKYGIFHK